MGTGEDFANNHNPKVATDEDASDPPLKTSKNRTWAPLEGQSGFTLGGVDLSTGEPLMAMIGCDRLHTRS